MSSRPGFATDSSRNSATLRPKGTWLLSSPRGSIRPLTLVVALALVTTLQGCETLSAPTTVPGTQTRPAECSEFAVIRPSRGKPGGATVDEIEAQLRQPDDPLGHARNYLGDTASTIEQIDENNAAWHGLCDGE